MDVNKWYFFGQRKFNIINTKHRNNKRSLNHDLYRSNIKNESGCICGFECEKLLPLFMECSLYNNIRRNV